MKKFLKVLFVLLLIFVAAGVTVGLVRGGKSDAWKHELHAGETVLPTCTQDGHTGDITCTLCGEKLLAGEKLPALGHEVQELPAVAPTCTQEGLTAGSRCTRCDAVLTAQEVIPALGHEVQELPAVAPTCTQEGLTVGSHCTRCDTVLTAQEVIPALGHEVQELPAVAATCTQEGLTAGSRCTRCDVVLTAQEAIPALGHESVTVIEAQAATCTQDGYTAVTKCSRCNVLLQEQEPVSALGHELAELPAQAATCTQEGLTAGARCTRCNEVLTAQEVIPALGHTFGEWEYAVTHCYESKNRECTLCGEIEKTYTQKENHVQANNSYHCEHCGTYLITVSGTTITGCNSALEELTIYNNADGIIIRDIAAYAFAGKNLRDVKIKTNLDYIGAYAFFGCYEDLRIAFYTDYGANSNIEKWGTEWYYGNGDFETPFYYYTTHEPVVETSEVTHEGS